MSDLKNCSKCRRELPSNNTYFFRNSKTPDKLFKTCKECNGYGFRDMKSEHIAKSDRMKVCRKCEEEYTMDKDHFMKNSLMKDGFSNKCKVCDGYKFTHHIVEEGYKTCVKCTQTMKKDTSNFHVSSDRKDGFSSTCKNCKSGKDVENFNIEEWYDRKSKKFQNSWLFEDIQWVYENYEYITKQDLLNYFNREINYKTLVNIIYQWDKRKKEKNDDWSKEDIELLRIKYPTTTQEELEKIFTGRTWHSIKIKASKLDIHRGGEILFTIRSESHKGKFSRERRLKLVKARRGKRNHNWRGGVSPLHPILRDKIKLWKFDSLEAYDFKCALSGINDGTLHVHHVNVNFSDIIQETFSNLEIPINGDFTQYSSEQILQIEDEFIKLHYKYGLGVPITAQIHRIFHSIYGNTKNTPEQFEEFKERYYNGEFKHKLNEGKEVLI